MLFLTPDQQCQGTEGNYTESGKWGRNILWIFRDPIFFILRLFNICDTARWHWGDFATEWDMCGIWCVVRVTSLQGESESLKQSAEESRCKAVDQSEQLLAVMTTLKDEHLQVHSVYTHKL